MKSNTSCKSPHSNDILWISFLRVGATLLIFIYHLQGVYEGPQYALDTVALVAFMFISGCLINGGSANLSIQWLVRRFLRILVPYWLIMPFVIAANEIYNYKKVLVGEYVISFLVGGFFLKNSIYAISWFITFILMCYLFAYVIFDKKKYIQIIASVLFCAAFFFHFKWVVIFAVFFVAGFFCRKITIKNKKKNMPNVGISYKILHAMQINTYYFFLLHAGVIQFSHKILALKKLECFIVSLILTSILCVPCKAASNLLINKITEKLNE